MTITNKIAATTITPRVPTSKKRNLKSFFIPRSVQAKGRFTDFSNACLTTRQYRWRGSGSSDDARLLFISFQLGLVVQYRAQQ